MFYLNKAVNVVHHIEELDTTHVYIRPFEMV